MTTQSNFVEQVENRGITNDVVALVRHEGDLSTSARLSTLKKGVDLIGGLGTLRSPFIVKPNVHTHRAWSTTMFNNTSSKMVEAVINLALKENQNLVVKIVESDSTDKFISPTWAEYGYKELEDRLKKACIDASLVNLSEQPLVSVPFNGIYFKEIELHKFLTEKGYFVSVAVPKTHPITFVTGVMKNMFGLLPRKTKGFYHRLEGSVNINHVILDVINFIKPDLCILDAIVGMEGVTHGRPKRLNAMIVGRNPVSVDATMTRLMGFEPESILHLVEGEKLGLGTLNPKIIGESLENMTVKFKPPEHVLPMSLVNPPQQPSNR